MRENSINNIWTVGTVDENAVSALSAALGIKEFLAKVLVAKGYVTPEMAKEYLNSNLSDLSDPFLLKDMDIAVNRIRKAVSEHEKIMIYGDYDVDGITSVAALWRYLTFKGAEAYTYIPERVNEGYGLNTAAIEKFAKDGIKLIITVDSGITAHDEIEFAKSIGIDVVITDHHECREELPEAVAVVNPHRADSNYPFRELAGVGVVFRLICAYEGNKNLATICNKYSDIVALGTVADVMPIVGENRIIVKYGLGCLSNTKNKGLCSLIEQTFSERKSVQKKNLTASSIGYGLAPRINAAGRIGDVNRALQLLITEEKCEADNIASYLCAVNRERQLVENKIFEQAVELIESNHDFDNDKVIVLVSESWHLGVIGIVASKITERYKLPSILISVDGDVGKGSARSIKGFNINEAISSCKDLLIKYGGHELAAGLTVDKNNVDAFRKAINEYAKSVFDFDSVCNYINAEFEITPNDVTVENAKLISEMEPFGLGNPQPTFCLRDVTITDIYSIGEGKHLKMLLEKDGCIITALYFGMPRERFPFSDGDKADFMVSIDMNDFRGTLSVQVVVKDAAMTQIELMEKESNENTFAQFLNGENVSLDDRHIPVMSHFKSAFLYLKSEIKEYDKAFELDVWSAAKAVSRGYNTDCSSLMFNIILCVFEELGLIQMKRIKYGTVEVILNKTEGKVNIEQSEILASLKN